MDKKSSNRTTYAYDVEWRGQRVVMQSDEPCDCGTPGACLDVMHHYGPDGKHYCPTGFLWCGRCCGVAGEPIPHSCIKWETE